MDNLFPRGWYGRHWFEVVLHDPVLLMVSAAVIIALAFAFLRMPRGK